MVSKHSPMAVRGPREASNIVCSDIATDKVSASHVCLVVKATARGGRRGTRGGGGSWTAGGGAGVLRGTLTLVLLRSISKRPTENGEVATKQRFLAIVKISELASKFSQLGKEFVSLALQVDLFTSQDQEPLGPWIIHLDPIAIRFDLQLRRNRAGDSLMLNRAGDSQILDRAGALLMLNRVGAVHALQGSVAVYTTAALRMRSDSGNSVLDGSSAVGASANGRHGFDEDWLANNLVRYRQTEIDKRIFARR